MFICKRGNYNLPYRPSGYPRATKTSDRHLNPCGKYRFDLDENLHGAALRPLRTQGDNP